MLHVTIHGSGRMAKAISSAAAAQDDLFITATVAPETPDWESDCPHFFSLDALPALPALLIDFTLPEGTRTAAEWCVNHDVALLSGVTGLSAEVKADLRTAAQKVPVLWSPNLSLGINLLAELAKQAAAVLDPKTQVEIEDIHHQWKKDAPSGTALMLGETITAQRGREGTQIEYSSIREGEIIGEHKITFHMAGEEFDLVHRAHDRSIYALGALGAGKWLVGQPAGLYSASDWLVDFNS
ncbi:MAG: 4-hydroxy-tetrahydrodipicolinate reductase [Proteobacteria bacterium]|nr:4-hydroxy-tetrahydrodipicolinate reductase [Pseudomonadota bacterium]